MRTLSKLLLALLLIGLAVLLLVVGDSGTGGLAQQGPETLAVEEPTAGQLSDNGQALSRESAAESNVGQVETETALKVIVLLGSSRMAPPVPGALVSATDIGAGKVVKESYSESDGSTEFLLPRGIDIVLVARFGTLQSEPSTINTSEERGNPLILVIPASALLTVEVKGDGIDWLEATLACYAEEPTAFSRPVGDEIRLIAQAGALDPSTYQLSVYPWREYWLGLRLNDGQLAAVERVAPLEINEERSILLSVRSGQFTKVRIAFKYEQPLNLPGSPQSPQSFELQLRREGGEISVVRGRGMPPCAHVINLLTDETYELLYLSSMWSPGSVKFRPADLPSATLIVSLVEPGGLELIGHDLSGTAGVTSIVHFEDSWLDSSLLSATIQNGRFVLDGVGALIQSVTIGERCIVQRLVDSRVIAVDITKQDTLVELVQATLLIQFTGTPHETLFIRAMVGECAVLSTIKTVGLTRPDNLFRIPIRAPSGTSRWIIAVPGASAPLFDGNIQLVSTKLGPTVPIEVLN